MDEVPVAFDAALREIAARERAREDAWLSEVQRWVFRRRLHDRLGDLLEQRAYAYDSQPEVRRG